MYFRQRILMVLRVLPWARIRDIHVFGCRLRGLLGLACRALRIGSQFHHPVKSLRLPKVLAF